MSAESIALVLLAAGRGSRFGGAKLAALLDGKPLAQHAAESLAALPVARRIAICSPTTPELPGFERVLLTPPDAPLSRSIATGIASARQSQAVLFALADMPLVPTDHYARLIAMFDGSMIGTRVGALTMVPAIFGESHFSALQSLRGDRGAGALLRDAPSVDLAEGFALDIDTPEDLQNARQLLQGR
ncbi:nucleotidyltransferase family protein [Novosphingobium taihuense]|uniref:CTP:molybdopterin cytidylyltransferase MocA n=1 Tax=Novosphingobium taihuense TaxID=260085 RepID=A0A7W7ETN9_9SPHN|nr:nucleotidyltransferase family protein [Novosphingobium taihuense]MBB4613578.1 CTP:molybdopterin cytidylyltransferase MocA [Novosphingobium taihuense]